MTKVAQAQAKAQAQAQKAKAQAQAQKAKAIKAPTTQATTQAQPISSLTPPPPIQTKAPSSSPPIGLQQQMKAKAKAQIKAPSSSQSSSSPPISLQQQMKAKAKAQIKAPSSSQSSSSQSSSSPPLPPSSSPVVSQQQANANKQVDRIYGQLSKQQTNSTTWSILPINEELKSNTVYRKFFIDAIKKKYSEIKNSNGEPIPLLILGYYKIPALRDDIDFRNFMVQLMMEIDENKFVIRYLKYREPEMEDLMMMRYITKECVQPLSGNDSKKVRQCKRSYCKYWPGFKWLCRIFPTIKSLSQKYDWARKFIEQQKGRDDNWAANFLMDP
jgi:hypothetical protein